ncbi:dimethyl sulfoxide reductase anchor subunit, partial [Proteus terrae]|uniref:DmsC/YnfH family molybdoenzyme membrane anchor subunit n=1 Tax=Proteus terrae TaxID=1574161 RepID=UPI00331568D7
GLAGLGSIASITHLGVPLNAPNAIRNVFSAWLSREVVVTAIFFLLIKVLQRIGSKLGIEIPQGSFPIRWKWQLWGIMTFSLIGR